LRHCHYAVGFLIFFQHVDLVALIFDLLTSWPRKSTTSYICKGKPVCMI